MSGNEALAACVAEAYRKKPSSSYRVSGLDLEIIAGASRRGATNAAIARAYGVSQPTISRAIKRYYREGSGPPGAARLRGDAA